MVQAFWFIVGVLLATSVLLIESQTAEAPTTELPQITELPLTTALPTTAPREVVFTTGATATNGESRGEIISEDPSKILESTITIETSQGTNKTVPLLLSDDVLRNPVGTGKIHPTCDFHYEVCLKDINSICKCRLLLTCCKNCVQNARFCRSQTNECFVKYLLCQDNCRKNTFGNSPFC